MQNYLEPEDDGLVMRETGAWAAEKLDYLARYIDIFETSMRARWPIRNYIDLMAGPGKNVVRDSGQVLLGSPLLALTTTHPFSGYFFADLEQAYVEALRQRCTASPICQRVDIRVGDCNVLVDAIVAHLKRDEQRSLNLSFLDPQGIDLHWTTVARLATVQRMDLIINYPEGGLNRAMPQAIEREEPTSIDEFFGTTHWREIYRENVGVSVGLHRELIDLYKQKLQELSYADVRQIEPGEDEPLMRNVKRHAPLYRLLFASKHPLGHDFWFKVTRRNVHGQRRLF